MVTLENERGCAQVAEQAAQIQEATGSTVVVAFVDRGHTGDQPAADAEAHGTTLEVVKLTMAKRRVVPLPRRGVVERSFASTARFRRLVRDYELLAETAAGIYAVAFAMPLVHQFVTL